MKKRHFYQCKYCNQIFSDESLVSKKCNFCQCSNLDPWPSSEVQELMNLVQSKENQDAFEYQLIASVFVSSAFELLLEKQLFIMAMEGLVSEEVEHLINALLDSNQGKSRRLSLYHRLGYGSFTNEAKQLGYPKFVAQWNKLTAIRNKSVHGNVQQKIELTPAFVNKLIDDGLDVFSRLHNKYNSESLQVVSQKTQQERESLDQELLSRWVEGKPIIHELIKRKNKTRKDWEIEVFFDC